MSMIDKMRLMLGLPTATAAATQSGRIEANTLSILTIERNAATQAQQNHAETLAAVKQCRDALMMAVSGLQLLVSSDGADDRKTLADILAKLDKIDQEVNGDPADTVPATVRFIVPTYRHLVTGEPIKMPTSLVNDAISNIALEFDNLAGKSVDPPQGGTVTLSVVDASGAPSSVATAAMGADGVSVDVTPTPGDGSNLAEFTVMFDDMANADFKASLDCNFTDDPNAANVHFRTDKITTRPISP